ncbi:MAG: hypothetical protein UT32_C0019G0014 [Parcubacteria group bacterium GW2011_GWC2_39_14]|nr:MAG: hypothetical protein UT32_C0019G0014 [Parcubacteria group bacterium GW2011_GWC2_39_14]KKR54547.1 MAG: hypothetical protein UT91_C0013G0014 [Parcubacteria group bacterium GW2011_GWA2_40_23]
MFDQLKMLKQAHDLQKKLEGESTSTEFKGIKITMNGKQVVTALTLDNDELLQDKYKLESALKDAFNNATHNSQVTMAEKMRGDMGSMFGL